MIEFDFLLFVLLLLYFVECAIWVRAGSTAFRLPSGPTLPLRMITKPRAANLSGIVFAFPLFFRGGGVVVSTPWPVFVSPMGIVAEPRFAPSESKFVAFEDILHVEHAQQNLLINGKRFAAANSNLQAAQLERFVRRIKKRKLHDRPVEIERELARCFEVDRARSLLNEHGERTFNLRFDSLMLFLAIFIASPVVVWRWGLNGAWPFLLSYLVLNLSLIAWDFRRTDRDLYRDFSEGRAGQTLTILISPPVALHATKYLTRDIGFSFHPLALAAAGSSDEDFRSLASRVLRDLMFATETSLGADNRATECAEWFGERALKIVSALIREKGFSPEDLVSAPRRESESARSFCPRCLSQFVITDGNCADCGGIPLTPFDPRR